MKTIAQFYIDDRKASVSELETIAGSMVQSIEVSFSVLDIASWKGGRAIYHGTEKDKA